MGAALIRRIEALEARRRAGRTVTIVIMRGGRPARAVHVVPARGPFDRPRSVCVDARVGDDRVALLDRLRAAVGR